MDELFTLHKFSNRKTPSTFEKLRITTTATRMNLPSYSVTTNKILTIIPSFLINNLIPIFNKENCIQMIKMQQYSERNISNFGLSSSAEPNSWQSVKKMQFNSFLSK